MATEVGTAYVTLIPSARGFASKMQSELGGDVARFGQQSGDDYGRQFSDRAGKGIKGRAKSVLGGLAKAGPLVAAAAGAAVGKVLVDSIGEAREAAVVGARTDNVIKKMGASAWTSSKQISDLAGALSNKAGVDDEAIQSGQNLLLTFGNVRNEVGKGNDIFDQTSALMVDMSAAMGTDMKGSAIQLGKALNDPVKGVSALSRVGVSFTEQQKEQIKTLTESGDVLGAQKIVLGEVEKQFGGAAAAMATPADRAKVAWGNFQEQIGTYLLPVVDKVLTAIADGLPQVISFATQAGGVIKQQLGPAFELVRQIVTDLFNSFSGGKGGSKLSEYVTMFRDAFESIRDIVSTAVELLTTLWNSEFGARFRQVIVTTFSSIVGVIGGALKIIQGILNVVMGLIKGDWSRVWTGIKQILSGVWKIILSILRLAWVQIKVVFLNGLAMARGLWSRLWQLLRTLAGKGIDALVSYVRNLPRRWLAILNALPGVMRAVFTKVFSTARGIITGGISMIVDAVRSIPGKLRALGSKFLGAGRDVIQAFIRGLSKVGSIAADFASGIWSAVRGAINSGIDALNRKLEFDFKVKGVGFTVNAPDIGHLATGGRAYGAQLAVIGEGREAETVFPDSTLAGFLERMTSAAVSSLGGIGGGRRVALVLADGTQLDAYIDERIDSQRALTAEQRRAGVAI